jgi:hypothetical protein
MEIKVSGKELNRKDRNRDAKIAKGYAFTKQYAFSGGLCVSFAPFAVQFFSLRFCAPPLRLCVNPAFA